MNTLRLTLAILSILSPAVRAHDHGNGMDMSMDGGMSLAVGQMLSYLHFTSGDNLLFLGWVPKSVGAMVGTCIGLFLLALVERWISACRTMMELHWSKRAQIIQSNRVNAIRLPTVVPGIKKSFSLWDEIAMRTAPPFIPAHDFTRGVIQIGQSAIDFSFMLTAM
jgi:copper transporter 1